MRNLFYSLISLIIAIFFIVVGIICVIIPWSPDVQTGIIQFILNESIALSLFGLTVIVIGLAIVANIWVNSRKRHYYIRSKDNTVAADEVLVQQYLNIYWKQLFPEHDIPSRLTLKKNKIHVAVDLPYIPLPEQRNLLERIKQELSSVFTKALGYQDEFFLSATFQRQPKKKPNN
jgi:hypothetical protein